MENSRLLQNKETVSYEYISQFINMHLKDYLKCSIESTAISLNLPPFYKEVLNASFSLKAEPKTIEEVQREFFLNNKYVKIKENLFLMKMLYENGLI